MPIIGTVDVADSGRLARSTERLRAISFEMVRGVIRKDAMALLCELSGLDNVREITEADPDCFAGYWQKQPCVCVELGQHIYILEAEIKKAKFNGAALYYWCCGHMVTHYRVPNAVVVEYRVSDADQPVLVQADSFDEAVQNAIMQYAFGVDNESAQCDSVEP